MNTKGNALREQGVKQNFQRNFQNSHHNFNLNKGLGAYKTMRQVWLAEHPKHSEIELLEACISLSKVCGLKLTKAYCWTGLDHEYF